MLFKAKCKALSGTVTSFIRFLKLFQPLCGGSVSIPLATTHAANHADEKGAPIFGTMYRAEIEFPWLKNTRFNVRYTIQNYFSKSRESLSLYSQLSVGHCGDIQILGQNLLGNFHA